MILPKAVFLLSQLVVLGKEKGDDEDVLFGGKGGFSVVFSEQIDHRLGSVAMVNALSLMDRNLVLVEFDVSGIVVFDDDPVLEAVCFLGDGDDSVLFV